ncbi:MAG: TetR/AcrR family transcriptional regulator, partial [Pseudarcicella sp.]|nr:TetR/AcrR family transcriptional regulator [Pseudarcicella sp.]
IEQGMFRKELNIEIIARMRMQQIEMGFDTQVFAVGQFTVLQVQLEFLDHFVRGILTKEGLELYEEYLTIKKIGTQ